MHLRVVQVRNGNVLQPLCAASGFIGAYDEGLTLNAA